MSQLRSMIRGRRLIIDKEVDRLNFISVFKVIKDDESLVKIKTNKVVFGNDSHLITRYVHSRIMNELDVVKKSISISVGRDKPSLVLRLPQNYYTYFERHAFKVNRLASKLSWFRYVSKQYLKGILVSINLMFLVILSLVRRTIFRNQTTQQSDVYLANLQNNNLPSSLSGAGSKTIINWYITYKEMSKTNISVFHNVLESTPYQLGKIKITPSKYPFPIQLTIDKSWQFARWVFLAQVVSLIDLVCGKWWTPILLADAARAYLVSLTEKNLLAKQYLFNNSSSLRPLWTYEAEKKGSDVVYYFYSTNCEGFDKENLNDKRFTMYYDMDWSNYLVWDTAQAEFVSQCVRNKPTIEKVGYVEFSDCAETINTFTERNIAVFDVTPFRESTGKLTLANTEFYTYEIVSKFIKDIVDVSRNTMSTILYKQKRDVGNSQEPRYRRLLQRESLNVNFKSIHSCIAASRVIEQSKVVISIPFTSTAIIGRSLMKPSIYYDPTGELDLSHPSAHGVPIIGDKNSLEDWLNEQYSLK